MMEQKHSVLSPEKLKASQARQNVALTNLNKYGQIGPMQIQSLSKKQSHQRKSSTGNPSLGPTLSQILGQTQKHNPPSAAISSLTASQTENSSGVSKTKKKKRAQNIQHAVPLSIIAPASRQIASNAVTMRSSVLINHGQLNYATQSKLLQQSRDQALQKKVSIKTQIKKSSTQISAVPINAKGHSMATLNAHASEGNFSNVTIKSLDKYNSIVAPKKSIGQKHRTFNINEHNVQQATINIANHPLSAKNAEKKKNIVYGNQDSSSHKPQSFAFNEKVVQHANYQSQGKIASTSKGSSFTVPSMNNAHHIHSMIDLGSQQHNSVITQLQQQQQKLHSQIYHQKAASLGAMSYTSNPSNYTRTRPKNPTDCSSVSSKGSIDSLGQNILLSSNPRLINKLSQTASIANKIDVNKFPDSSASPQKPIQITKTGTGSKFTIVNRGAISTNQFPNVVVVQQMSPKNSRIAQSMSSSNFLKAGQEIQTQVESKSVAQESKSMQKSGNQGFANGPKNDETITSEGRNADVLSEQEPKSHKILKLDIESLSASGTFANDPIIEELVEDSAHATKRQSLDEQSDFPQKNEEKAMKKLNTQHEESKKPQTKKPIAQEQKQQIIQLLEDVKRISKQQTAPAPPQQTETTISTQIKPSSQYFSNPQQPNSSMGELPAFPITGRQAVLIYGSGGLTDYEKIEIRNYEEVYFLGLTAPKIKGSTVNSHNFGYDDERGDYQVVIKDQLGFRYEVIDKLGSGSFGQALKCFDHKEQQLVAIKVIRNKKRFQYQAGVELRILKYLKDRDKDDDNNIIRIIDYEIFRRHLLISFELLSMNLYEFIKSNNFVGVSIGLIRRFAIQILQALKFQRDNNIIHCDLKPENILLKQPNKSGIKVIDYGSSCFQNQRIYTYIQSRFYRAPEIILGIPYTTAIDMWSFGCIMAELYTGYPLFPGENEAEQLAYMMEIKGVPADYIVELSTRRHLFFEKDSFFPIIVTNSRGRKRIPNSKTLKSVLRKCGDAKFLDFIDQCLDWDPVNRMTPLEALQHDWILEGLPEKVLVHHQRMFTGKEDKINLKEASLTQIQGFPENAANKSIYEIVDELKAQDQRKLRHKSNGSVVNIETLRPSLQATLSATEQVDVNNKVLQDDQNPQYQMSNNKFIIADKGDSNFIQQQQKKAQPQIQNPLSAGQSFVEKANVQRDDTINATGTELPSIDSPAKIFEAKKLANQASYSTNALVNKTNKSLEETKKNNVMFMPQLELESSKAPFQTQSKLNVIQMPLTEHAKDYPKINQAHFASQKSADDANITESQRTKSQRMPFNVDKQSVNDSPKRIEKGLVKSKDATHKKTLSQGGPNIQNLRQAEEKTVIAVAIEETSDTLTEHQPGGIQLTSESNKNHRDIHELINQKKHRALHPSVQSEEQRLNSYPSKYSIGYGSNGSVENYMLSVGKNGELGASIAIDNQKHEEEDFEEPAMPTDDEEITNFSKTQKIPISLIKKQDKASVSLQQNISNVGSCDNFQKLFQSIPPHENAVTSRASKSNSIFNQNAIMVNTNAGIQLTVYGLNKNDNHSIILGPGKKDAEVEIPFYSDEKNTTKKRKEKPQNTLMHHQPRVNSYFPATQPQHVNIVSNQQAQSARTVKLNSVVIPGKSTAPGKVPIKMDYSNQAKNLDFTGTGTIKIQPSAIQRADPYFQTNIISQMPENVTHRQNEGNAIKFNPSINEPNKLITSSRTTNSANHTLEQSAKTNEYFVAGNQKQSATVKQASRKQPQYKIQFNLMSQQPNSQRDHGL